jgi:hypothetical protein
LNPIRPSPEYFLQRYPCCKTENSDWHSLRCAVLLLLLLVLAASMAIIVLRSSWPWASKICWHRHKPWTSFLHVLGRLLIAGPYVASCAWLIATPHDTVTNTSITVSSLSLPLIRMRNSTIPQALFAICRRLRLSNQPSQDFQRCMSCQHRHSRSLRTSTRIPLFSVISDSDFQIAAHHSLALRGQDQEDCHRQSLLPIHSRQ